MIYSLEVGVMIIDEDSLKSKFESIFDGDPNFESEPENTKAWAFRAFVAAERDNLGILFVKTMNERLFKHYEGCEDFSFAPSFEFNFGIDYSVIKFGGVIIWRSKVNGRLDEEETINYIMERVRKVLAFCSEQKFEDLLH